MHAAPPVLPGVRTRGLLLGGVVASPELLNLPSVPDVQSIYPFAMVLVPTDTRVAPSRERQQVILLDRYLVRDADHAEPRPFTLTHLGLGGPSSEPLLARLPPLGVRARLPPPLPPPPLPRPRPVEPPPSLSAIIASG